MVGNRLHIVGMAMQPDRTDRRILALLETNARISVAEIGRRIGLSRPAVQSRIDAMEQSGLIRGYHAEMGAGAGLVRAVLFVRIAGRPCGPALNWLSAQEGVTSVASLAGEIDALVTVSVPSAEDLSALNDRIAASKLIADVQSHILLRGRLRG